MKRHTPKLATIVAAAVAAASTLHAHAGTSTNASGQPTQNGAGNPAITISIAGQTALRGFTNAPAISLLQPGTSITLHNGPNNSAVTYWAPNDPGTSVQLAAKNFTQADTGIGATGFDDAPDSQNQSAIRVEWQEKGSLDGFYDLINDQIGYTAATGPISILSSRGASSANPIWINTTQFTGGTTGTTTSSNGHSLVNGSGLAYYDTYATTPGPSQVYDALTGTNIKGGQNRVQVAVGEYKTENFAYAGTPSPFAAPGASGYGLGNPSLKATPLISGVGIAGARQSFNQTTVANESADKIDPQTSAAYTSGPWNTAGADNIDSQQFAATAVLVAANPGTGLKRLNLTDTQWIEAAGRLQNGANFNTVSRVANTGQRNVLAANTGLDPTWATGENDGGDTSTTALATAQSNIGSLKFSGKSSGTFSRNAIAQSRLGVGALSLAETRGAAGNAPVRALDIDFTDTADPLSAGQIDDSKFIGLSNADSNQNFANFANGTYKATLISHYNLVKAPNQTAVNNFINAYHYATLTATGTQTDPSTAQISSWWAGNTVTVTGGSTINIPGATVDGRNGPLTTATGPLSSATGAKGDPYGDVVSFVDNITGSVATLAANNNPPASIADPADGLLANGFFLPGLLNFKRTTDGGPLTPNPLDANQQALQDFAKAAYPNTYQVNNSFGTSTQTIGSTAIYGALNSSTAAFNGTIAITAKNDSGTLLPNGTEGNKGNYLFGNFNQDGRRDYASAIESVNAALSLYAYEHTHGANTGINSAFTADGGVANSTVIPSLSGSPGWASTAITKGDLIVLGDANGDGKFDGADIYFLATGASLADNVSSTHLTALNDNTNSPSTPTFADALRSPTAVLRKNAALDSVYTLTSNINDAGQTFLRQSSESTAAQANDAANHYLNAFNKSDVTRDGLVDVNDAVIVDQSVGKDYTNLTDELTSVASIGGSVTPISLVQIRQHDGITTDGSGNVHAYIDASDLAVINTSLTGTGALRWYADASAPGAIGLKKTGTGTILLSRTGGTVKVETGALFEIGAGAFIAEGTNQPFIDNTGSATNGNALGVIVDSGATLQTGGVKQVGALTVAGTVSVEPASTGHNILTTSALSITGTPANPTGAIALNPKSDLVIQSGYTTDQVRQLAKSGYASGAWTGPGLRVQTPAAGAGIGYITGSDYSQLYHSNVADGVTLASTDILIKYTYQGDADLSGTITLSDYARIDAGFFFPTAAPAWDNGDFNYDGIVDWRDYALIDAAFSSQGGPLAGQEITNHLALFGDGYAAALSAALAGPSSIPEPASLGLLIIGGLALAKRRVR